MKMIFSTQQRKIIKISRIENVITVKSMRTSIGGTSYDETYGQKGVIEIATFNIKSCQVLNYDTTLIFIKLENEDK